MTLVLDLDALDFAKSGGLVTVVAQDAVTGTVLMVAHADREALARCLVSGEMHYTSRLRGAWHKGATSGHVQRIVSLEADCDGDAVLARVVPLGPACHTGLVSCFPRTAVQVEPGALEALDRAIAARAVSLAALQPPKPATAPEQAPPDSAAAPPALPSYTQRLLTDRNLRLKKLGEEVVELATACADGDAARGAEEGADLVYHVLVALRALGVSWRDVERVLESRAGRSR